jgi:hypothetical protein
MAKTATNRGKLSLSCGDVQQCAVTPELSKTSDGANRTISPHGFPCEIHTFHERRRLGALMLRKDRVPNARCDTTTV